MKKKYLELKLNIINNEIKRLLEKEISVEVNLRKMKEKQWGLISELEELEESN